MQYVNVNGSKMMFRVFLAIISTRFYLCWIFEKYLSAVSKSKITNILDRVHMVSVAWSQSQQRSIELSKRAQTLGIQAFTGATFPERLSHISQLTEYVESLLDTRV